MLEFEGVETCYGDRHYIIEKGRVVWTGDSAQPRASEAIRHRYLGVSLGESLGR